MKSEWTWGPLMLRLYLFVKKADAILFWGGSVVAFMIGGWAAVAWWVLALIAIPLLMMVWAFFRAFLFPTREMEEATLRASWEEERRKERIRQWGWEREQRRWR